MGNISIRKLSIILFGLLLLIASISAFFTTYISVEFSRIQTAWASYKAQNNEKARLNSSLYAVLGYGGMIHNFKNYILRKDSDYYANFEQSMGAVQGVVDQYYALSSTTTERVALNDIQAMLNYYKENVIHIRNEIEEGTLSAHIGDLAEISDSLALRGLKILSDEISNEDYFFKDKNNKPVIVKNIRAEMGYGRMIHSFKNYVIRKDKKYRERALSSIANIDENIKRYLKLDCSAGEKTALEDIENVIHKYESNIQLVDKGIQENLTPEEIDAQVRVDDSNALRGLKMLDQDTINQINEKSAQLSLMLGEISWRERVNSVIVIISNVSIAILIFVVFSKKIIRPIKKISETMIEMAKGNLGIDTENCPYDKNYGYTELGNMEASLRIFRDNEQKRRDAEEGIRKLALTDPLTGLANRNQFEKKYHEMMAFARRDKKSIALMAIDLDDFKIINDEYGHAAGDVMLQAVAKNLLLTFRETDLVARLGGDEFSIILYGAENIAEVIKAAKRLLTLIPSPVPFGKDMLSVGVSIGIAQQNYEDVENLDLLKHNADKALYKAKQSGKNTYSLYEPETSQNNF